MGLLFVRVWDYIIVREVRIRLQSDVFGSGRCVFVSKVTYLSPQCVSVSEVTYLCLRVRISV